MRKGWKIFSRLFLFSSFAIVLFLVASLLHSTYFIPHLATENQTATGNTITLSNDSNGSETFLPLIGGDDTASQSINNSGVNSDQTTTDVENNTAGIGREVSVATHLVDGDEFRIPLTKLLAHGANLFSANWTPQEGGGRPQTTGTGSPLADTNSPLVFPRNFNRISGPDANSCAGCHNMPFGLAGGSGDFVTSVFVLGQRFDFATFDASDRTPIRGSVDENGNATTLQNIANRRATVGMHGSGYIEMLARQITEDLQFQRDGLHPGESRALISKGIHFGMLSRDSAGNWDVSLVEGLPAPSLATTDTDNPPNLIIRPFHQAGAVISLRQFTNNAFNHHHGIQTTERFGQETDPDGDGFTNELTKADVTAVSVFQAAMAVPGRVIPNDPIYEQAIWNGEQKFETIGCASCHISQLPLDDNGWIYTEPNPYNPDGNLQIGQGIEYEVDLGSRLLPPPRLMPENGIVQVPAYTDFKLHDITSGADDPNREILNMHESPGTAGFTEGNSYFLTRTLWGVANQPPYFHHGQYMTMREATLAHDGEAVFARRAFEQLSDYDQNSIIEFLKSLQVLPAGTQHTIVDENGVAKSWPPTQR